MIDKIKEDINERIKEASAPLLVSISLLTGILIGISISTYQFPNGEVHVASKKYKSILNLIEKEYADSVDIHQLFESGGTAMWDKLDPHSSYVSSEDFITKSVLDSDFEGVGIRYFYLRDTLFIAEIIDGGPADKADLYAGDRLIEVNDSSIVGIEY